MTNELAMWLVLGAPLAAFLIIIFGIIRHAKCEVLTTLRMAIFNLIFSGSSNILYLHPKTQSHSSQWMIAI